MYTSPDKSIRQFRKRSLLLLAGALLATSCFAAILLVSKKGTSTSGVLCLTRQDYKDFTGTDNQGEFSPLSNFYTESFQFTDSGTYADSSDAEQQVKNIGQFYKTHPDTAVYIKIRGDYTYDQTAANATNRLERVVSDLVSAGVNEAAIHATEPTLLDDGEGESIKFVTVTITSPEDCKESS